MRAPGMIVFDLDACLWHPEMFELTAPPGMYDADAKGVLAGHDVVRLFDGARAVLDRCAENRKPNDSLAKQSVIGVASSTTEPAFANACLDRLLLFNGCSVGSLVSFRQIYPGNKGAQHIPRLSREAKIPYDEIIFFDDCEQRLFQHLLLEYRQRYACSNRQECVCLSKTTSIVHKCSFPCAAGTYGDNCADVAKGCPGTLCVRTPHGLTEALFDAALAAYAEGSSGILKGT
eukprot:6208511-Pleurochrysis_carterae.AAC.1